MVKHIVMWSYKEETGAEERKAAAAKIKADLEALVGVVPGLKRVTVITEPLSSSSHDLCLLTELESEEALKGYAVHPEHLKVVDLVRSVTCNRVCMDYEM